MTVGELREALADYDDDDEVGLLERDSLNTGDVLQVNIFKLDSSFDGCLLEANSTRYILDRVYLEEGK